MTTIDDDKKELHDEALAELGCIVIPVLFDVLIVALYLALRWTWRMVAR